MQPPREEYYQNVPMSLLRTAHMMDVELKRRKRTDIHKTMGMGKFR